MIWPILLIGIGGLILYSAVRPSRRTASSASVPRESSARLELDLSVGAGRFRLEGGTSADSLVEVVSTNDDIATRIERADDRALVRLRQDFAWWPDAWRGGSEWTVRLASDVPTLLTMNAGAGDFFVDLSTRWSPTPGSRSGPPRLESSCPVREARSKSGSGAARRS